MKKLAAVLALAALVAFSAGTAFAANLTLKVDSLSFSEAKQDVMGPAAVQKDGKLDGQFSLGVSGAQAIKEISLKNETTGKVWSTTLNGSGELLLVKDSAGNTLNSGNRMKVVPVLLAADFTLYINDAQAAIAKDSKFTATVTMIDGKTAAASVNVKSQAPAAPAAPKPQQPSQPAAPTKPAQPAAQPQTQQAAAQPQDTSILTFETFGASDLDLAGEGEGIGGNGHKDHVFGIRFFFKKDTVVKGLKITAEGSGKKAEWDTVAGNKAPLAVILDPSQNIVNKADGSVSFTGNGEAVYSIFVDDKAGVLSASDAKAKVTIALADGSMLEKEAVKGKKTAAKDSAIAEYRGIGKYDFVGQGKRLESNMNPDKFIGLSLNTTNTLTGVKIKDREGHAFDTIPSSKNPLVAVITPKNEKLNKSDGSISLQVKGPTELFLAFDEEDEKEAGPYHVTMVFADGSLIEATTAKPLAEGESDSITKADRAIKFLSKKPAKAALDQVGKNKKKGANGAKDMALSVQITGKGSITAMVLSDANGKGWDTLPGNNGRWLLGVRLGNKLQNTANGTVRVAVNGTKTYQLLMQDNGKLAAKKGALTLTTTWGDGEVTETELKW